MMRTILFGGATLGALIFAATAAAAPHFDDIRMSDSSDGDAADSFAPTTPKIFLHAHMVDVASGAKMKGSWIAVDTGGAAPANYAIDNAELTANGSVNTVTFSLSKPNNGWPLGHYRVDLSIDGKPSGSVPFDIEND